MWLARTNTNAASISPGAYPLCTLTYIEALTEYSKAGFTLGQEQTVAAYLAGVVTADEGQEALEGGKAFYAPLTDTTAPASDAGDVRVTIVSLVVDRTPRPQVHEHIEQAFGIELEERDHVRI